MQKSQHTFSEEECLDIFSEILKGMKVLVDHSYIHRDIKPANVLIKGNLYKIADYGFARKADIFCKTKMAEFCGTPIYMAPQLLWGEPYTAKCDVWSLGLMLYELLYGCPPWPCLSIEGYIEGIKKRPLSFPYKVAIGRGTRDFLVRALTVRESLRMNWEEVFNHEIIKNHKVGSILQMEPPPAHIRHILSSLQREVELKQVDLIQIFARYQHCSALDKKTFTALIREISPAITTNELNQIYQYMDLDKNGFIEFDEWKSVVCDMNYHDNYQESRMLEELSCIVKMRHIDLVKLFKKFDKNGSGALDHPEF
jgi:calcium-dependent protein kinase